MKVAKAKGRLRGKQPGCRHHGRSRARRLVTLFAHVMQVLAAGRAVSRSVEIEPPQRSHTRYLPVTTRWAARSRSSSSTRACVSMACTRARSNATVAPSGSCSSSLAVRADASTMPSHWRVNESIICTVRARSSPISSFAARRCAGESPAGSVGSSTTSPTKRASYPFRKSLVLTEPGLGACRGWSAGRSAGDRRGLGGGSAVLVDVRSYAAASSCYARARTLCHWITPANAGLGSGHRVGVNQCSRVAPGPAELRARRPPPGRGESNRRDTPTGRLTARSPAR
jgi:hypothetical protein